MIRPRKRSKIWPGRGFERCARPTASSSSSVNPARRDASSIRSQALGAYPTRNSRRVSSRSPRPSRYSRASRGLARLPQVPGVVDRRPLHAATAAALAAARRAAASGILGLDLELDPEPLGERLERAAEVEPLGLHHELERVARGLAAEAVVQPLVGADVERAGALLVKRADPEVAVDAGAAQLGPGGDQRDHVDRLADALAGVVGVARHGANATGTLSRSNVADAEPVGHPGQVVGDATLERAGRDRVGDLLGMSAVVIEQTSGPRARSSHARAWPRAPGTRART